MTGPQGGKPCRKVRFPTLAAAEHALLNAKLARAFRPHRTRRREIRAYVCKTCQAWHLSSKPPRQSKEDTAA